MCYQKKRKKHIRSQGVERAKDRKGWKGRDWGQAVQRLWSGGRREEETERSEVKGDLREVDWQGLEGHNLSLKRHSLSLEGHTRPRRGTPGPEGAHA